MERINILFGGPAGSGPNVLTHLTASALFNKGLKVFYSRYYQSLIRGGHNFNVLTFSEKSVSSNDSSLDVLVAFDKNTVEKHKENLNKSGLVIGPEKGKGNMYYAGKLFKILNLEFKFLDRELKKLGKRYNENLKEAKKGYGSVDKKMKLPVSKKSVIRESFLNGSQGISQGALKSGLNIYYAYPMTPATPVLTELAQATIIKKGSKKNKHKVIELENEISVANAGVGSAMTGALTMVGTSGGGFDLMSETLSLCGMAEIPLVFYLAQRPGPATGVATYTGQGDLNIALKSGHGEFPRIVLAPGTPEEAEELTNQAFLLSQKFQTPSIILSDKHLGESFYTRKMNKISKVKSMTKMKRYNSYEKDSKTASATENPEIINKNIDERNDKKQKIEKEAKKFKQFEVYGNKKSDNVLLFWGSTKGAVMDAIEDLDVKAIQILYMEPFPKNIEKELENKNIILVENNATGQLADLMAEKTGNKIKDSNKILRYDGRPFLADELRNELNKLGIK